MEDDPQQPDPSEPSSSDEMTDYLQIYLDECDEELEAFVESLLTLEDDPHNIEALNEAFRLLHTLKGSSGMMGFEGVSELTHEFENRFETFRTGDRLLDKATMGLLLECVDFLRAFNDGLRRGEQPLGDGSHLIARLAELDQKSANPSAAIMIHAETTHRIFITLPFCLYREPRGSCLLKGHSTMLPVESPTGRLSSGSDDHRDILDKNGVQSVDDQLPCHPGSTGTTCHGRDRPKPTRPDPEIPR